MKDRIVTNSLRSIKKIFPRFLSLLIMSMLGVFVFTGLRSTAPDMIGTLDNFLDEGNVYDLRLMSTMGLTNEDVDSLKKIAGIKEVEGAHSKSLLFLVKDEKQVLEVSSLPKNLNQIKLLEGKLPTKENEIVVERNLLEQTGYLINDQITFEKDEFTTDTFTIVGVIDSPLYFNDVGLEPSRGNTSIGTGSINYYGYVLDEAFQEEYYSTIYITIAGAKEMRTSKEEYVNLVDQVTNQLKETQKAREDARYESIYNEAKQKIDEEEQKANDLLTDAKKQLDDAQSKLTKASQTLKNASYQLSTNKKKLDEAKALLNSSKKEYQNALDNAHLSEVEIPSMITKLNEGIMELDQILATLPSNSEEYLIYLAQQNGLKEQLKNLQTLQGAKEKITSGEAEYQKNLTLYQSGYATYQKNYNLYQKNVNQYNVSLEEYNVNKDTTAQEIKEAREKLTEIKHPKWLIYDRSDYSTYAEYVDDTNSINNLAKIFPLVFFAVAILVSLISMNRMVEDDRGEIGTLKSLGFPNRKIMNKYLLFSFLATLIGGIIGVIVGSIFIPTVIFGIYKMLFAVPNFVVLFDLKLAFLGIFIALVCVCGTTILTVIKELHEKPSELMRPKAPKSGKRVFLERITWFWDHLKFSGKVTLRNIFRYKKRVIVTVGGIAGCTALILCGFGIKDAIVNLTDMQFGETFQFDALSYVNEMKESEIDHAFQEDGVQTISPIQTINMRMDKTTLNLFIAQNAQELNEVVHLKDSKNKPVNLEEGQVLVTDKLAEVKKINVGDKLELMDMDGVIYSFQVGGIIKNYVDHYVYVSKETFEQTGHSFEPNVVYLTTKELTPDEENKMISKLLENDKIINVSFIESLKSRVSNMLKSLDKVVLILIVLASLLAFVVLYNLSNINIQERKREIATLKVLGFYNKEVDHYITKENILLTILGIGLGLLLGYFLTNIVITTVEIEKARFIHQISLNSYLYAAIISSFFTIVVNFVTHFSLKKIDMIESLKSVE